MPTYTMDDDTQWYAMRDLTRPNAKVSAYEKLNAKGIRCFTPMVKKQVKLRGDTVLIDAPYMRDLLFAYGTREAIDPLTAPGMRLQYRYVRGGYMEPMTVRKADMENFIRAVQSTISARYYRPEEITPAMRNRKIRIIGGPLNGLAGTLVTIRGTRVKRLLVEIPTLLAAAVEVEPEYIQMV